MFLDPILNNTTTHFDEYNTYLLVLDINMLRKSKRLLDRSASDSLENDEPGGGVMENTPLIDAGSTGPIIVDPSAAVIPVYIVMEEYGGWCYDCCHHQ